jgi:hypothetical protein
MPSSARWYESVAILLVDICDSTEPYDLRCDDDACRLIDGCLSGLTGHVAARVASLAKAGEILFTGEVKAQLSPALRSPKGTGKSG